MTIIQRQNRKIYQYILHYYTHKVKYDFIDIFRVFNRKNIILNFKIHLIFINCIFLDDQY